MEVLDWSQDFYVYCSLLLLLLIVYSFDWVLTYPLVEILRHNFGIYSTRRDFQGSSCLQRQDNKKNSKLKTQDSSQIQKRLM
jgi:hypothetical protein